MRRFPVRQKHLIMTDDCQHRQRRIIAQDDATTYVECLECGRIFDTAELDEPPGEPSEFEEDLSDA